MRVFFFTETITDDKQLAFRLAHLQQMCEKKKGAEVQRRSGDSTEGHGDELSQQSKITWFEHCNQVDVCTLLKY